MKWFHAQYISWSGRREARIPKNNFSQNCFQMVFGFLRFFYFGDFWVLKNKRLLLKIKNKGHNYSHGVFLCIQYVCMCMCMCMCVYVCMCVCVFTAMSLSCWQIWTTASSFNILHVFLPPSMCCNYNVVLTHLDYYHLFLTSDAATHMRPQAERWVKRSDVCVIVIQTYWNWNILSLFR